MMKKPGTYDNSSAPSRASSSITQDTGRLVKRLINAATMLEHRGESIGRYFLRVYKHSVATQRATKERLSERLRLSETKPQIVTVQARSGTAGGTYLIIPLEKGTQLLEAQVEKDSFVPITVLLRRIGGDVKIPDMAPRRSRWLLRQDPVELVGPDVERVHQRAVHGQHCWSRLLPRKLK